MKRQLLKAYPALVLLLVCALLGWVHHRDAQHPLRPSPFQRFEWYLHDWRAQLALRTPTPSAATNLAVVLIDESSTKWMAEKFPAIGGRWPFHHFHYGPVLDELKAQGAKAVAFDIFFVHPDDSLAYRGVQHLTGTTNSVNTTDFFASRMRASGNVILATANELRGGPLVTPLTQLHTNALAVGIVSGPPDRDGTIRRVLAFQDDPRQGRVWCLGFVLAAQALGVDLRRTVVEPGRIRLACADGAVREVPLDKENCIGLDWVVRPERDILAGQRVRLFNFAKVFTDASNRGLGRGTNDDYGIRDSLVLIAASGGGMNSVDRAPSAIRQGDSIAFAHLNMANSLLTGRFLRRTTLPQELGITFALIAIATLAGWRLSTGRATAVVLVAAGAYAAFVVWIYVAHRWLLPIALPVFGALFTTHLVMVACRSAENAERRHLRRLLERVVSAKVINTLLASDSPTPQTRRVEITVLFADLRGFTRFSEDSQAQAEAAANRQGLPPERARAFADEAAREAMSTVNRYLAAVVDEVKATEGTLDKYMGDCVMAFWGAPVADPNHAANALKCAAAAQQAIERINQEHAAENERRERANQHLAALGQPQHSLLPVLRLGIGINTGLATVGFMGSENHLSSFTAFGHEVNVASRVEGLTKGGQVVLTEATLLAAARNDTTIATRCLKQPEVFLKGITVPVKVYELRWKDEPSGPPTNGAA